MNTLVEYSRIPQMIMAEKMKRSDFEELCSRMERLLLGQSAQYAVKGGAK